MNQLDYYAQQSWVTDPDIYINHFSELPTSIPALCKIIQGLLIHETDGKLFDYQIPKERSYETNLRSVSAMLMQLLKLDKNGLNDHRQPEKRLVVTCRDFAVLLCSMLRYHKIPARVRIGFSTYIFQNTNFKSDHALTEYWNQRLEKWCLVDARTSSFHIANKRHVIDFDIYDVPHDRFFYAGKAWHLCRTTKADPDLFGFGWPKSLKGWWYIRNKIMQDLAALNKFEPLLWDVWGFMLQQQAGEDPTSEQQIVCDQIAELTKNNNNNNFLAFRSIYTLNQNLTVPKKIVACSPSLGTHEVILSS